MLRACAMAIGVAVAASGPTGLAAQGQPLPRAWAFPMGPHQALLGVLVTTEAGVAMDSLGARVEAVTPGGPASDAGLKAGDVIIRFNGVSLGRGIGGVDDGGNPGRRLIELVRAIEPGDSVQVEYRRGAEMRKATLVAAAAEWAGVPPMEGGQGMARAELPGGPGGLPFLGPGSGIAFCFGDAWCDMELVNLNPDLGEYFGTKDGILVIKAPTDSSLPLKSGDVILSIGGRRPTSSAHAMRILGSYEPGETVPLEVMRKQRRTTITWHVPDVDNHMRPFMRLHDAPPDSGEDRSES